MKLYNILWVTKIHSNTATGGTKVSFNYIKALKDENNVTVLARISETKPSLTRVIFLKKLLRLRKEKFDIVVFDDHYSWLSIFFKEKYTIGFYHGNWPTLLWVNLLYFIKGCYLFPQYLFGMSSCSVTIFVNPFFQSKLSFFCPSSIVLLNPVPISNHQKPINNQDQKSGPNTSIVMVGTVDQRKYKNLVTLLINNKEYFAAASISIHIYGRLSDKKIVDNLSSFPNIVLEGLVEKVPYYNYDIHISTSSAENLPLSLFEALQAGLPCLYPNTSNYFFLKEVSGFYTFNPNGSDFCDSLTKVSNSNAVVDASFIPKSYQDNIRQLIEFKTNSYK